jgi:hypothetical protein
MGRKIKLTESQLISVIRRVLNETAEIDTILDKINKSGMESLNKFDRYVLDNSDVDYEKLEKNFKGDLIKKIKDKLSACHDIHIPELQLDSDIIYGSDEEEGYIYTVEILEDGKVTIVARDENGQAFDGFDELYESLDVPLLNEIWESIEGYDCESDVNDTIMEYYDRDKLYLKEPLIRKLTMKDGKGRFLTPKNIRDHINNLQDIEVEDSFGNVRVYTKVPEVIQVYLSGRY